MCHSSTSVRHLGFTRGLAVFAMTCVMFGSSVRSAAADTTYKYVGKPFTLFACGLVPGTSDPNVCPDPGATSYTTNDLVTGTLRFTNALPPNLPLQDVKLFPGFELTLSDGHQSATVTGGSSGFEAMVGTNAAGEISAWVLSISTGPNLAQVSTRNAAFAASDEGRLACCDPVADFGLSEKRSGRWSTGPLCVVELNGSAFENGQTVSVQALRFQNFATAAVPIEFKVWFEVPGVPLISMFRGGDNGSAVLPGGLDANILSANLFTVAPSTPRGTYGFNCRLFNPITGYLFSESLQPFVVE